MVNALDNPAWSALTGAQADFGIVAGRAGRYRPDISPIAAVADGSAAALEDLASVVEPGEIVAIIQNGEVDSLAWRQVATVPLMQWVCPGLEGPQPAAAWVELDGDDVDDMYTLAKATDPGPFERETWRLGDYIGVKINGELVAMAGERICFEGHREVSAVCTAEGHGGKGYAQALVAEIVRRQLAAGCLPFLHVRIGSPAEQIATRVYAKLGFHERCRYPMKILQRIAND